MWHLFSFKSDEFASHYHRRSNVESTFSMMKRKFGSSVRSKLPVAQHNEVLLKVLCHNLSVLVHEMHELGVEPLFKSVGAAS
jgi:transposase